MAPETRDYIQDMFGVLGSQDLQRAQLANGALSTGAAAYQKKDYTRAEAEFKRAIAMDPTNPQSYTYLANAYLAQKKYGEAIKTYQNSISLDPTQDSVHTNLGNIYLQQKKYNLAEKEFKEAAKLNPTDTLAPYTLGQLYVQTDRLAEAETQFKKVSRMAPNDPNPYYSLGAVYNKQEKFADAVTQLTKAIKLRPKMEAAHMELGIAYAGLGDTAKAQREVDILTKLNATQGELLRRTIAKPKLVAVGGAEGDTYNYALPDAQQELWKLDATLNTANASQEFRLTFFFDSKMDAESVQDTSNWTITRASGGAAGYYNNLQPIVPTEAYIPQNPTSVSYDPDNQSATLTFTLSQNSTNNATIDPSKVLFKFIGKDVTGKSMDSTADEFDGYAVNPF